VRSSFPIWGGLLVLACSGAGVRVSHCDSATSRFATIASKPCRVGHVKITVCVCVCVCVCVRVRVRVRVRACARAGVDQYVLCNSLGASVSSPTLADRSLCSRPCAS
jgi:hypothetical protein